MSDDFAKYTDILIVNGDGQKVEIKDGKLTFTEASQVSR